MNKEKREIIASTVEVIGVGRELNVDIGDDKIINLITDYISVHKWLINEKIDYKISYEQATFSWYENVYKPLKYAIHEGSLILKAFPDKEVIDIFSEISDLHYEESVNKKGAYIPYEIICKKYILTHSKRWVVKLIVALFF